MQYAPVPAIFSPLSRVLTLTAAELTFTYHLHECPLRFVFLNKHSEHRITECTSTDRNQSLCILRACLRTPSVETYRFEQPGNPHRYRASAGAITLCFMMRAVVARLDSG